MSDLSETGLESRRALKSAWGRWFHGNQKIKLIKSHSVRAEAIYRPRIPFA
ncbi:hypothetical protein CBOM_06905 [Ceraceosorus bombacis]|uniref:Uncharacterized protein n=1 Tax=Ceraceosorus bombacis TaxID=401625 RepID=A0A0P1BTI3_9BASI|nr:hypothetical protein CBOM_06905 [Ceraceosorus bombacis]